VIEATNSYLSAAKKFDFQDAVTRRHAANDTAQEAR
jgi:hypothetical protein